MDEDYQDGQTATNPKTGQKVVFRNGQWHAMPGTTPAGGVVGAPGITASARTEATNKIGTLNNLQRSINEVRDRFAEGPGGTTPWSLSALGDYLPTDSNKRFDDAAKSTRGFVGSALGFTASQLNTPGETEAAIGPYIPSASDRDSQIADKIARLQRLVDEGRAGNQRILGGPVDASQVSSNAGVPNISPPSGPPPSLPGGPPGGFRTVATGKTRSEQDVQANAVLDRMIRAGASAAEANAAVSAINGVGVNQAQYDAALQHFRKNPTYKGSYGNLTKQQQNTLSERAAGSAGGAFTGAALNAASGGLLSLGMGNQDDLVAQGAAFPTASLLGGVAGGAAGAFATEGLLGAAAAKAGGGLLSAIASKKPVSDGLFGALSGATSNPDNPLLGAVGGAGLSAAGGVVGNKVAAGIGGGVRGVTNEAVNLLTQRGVPLTFGGILGNRGMIGKAVNKLESLPVVGDLLSGRRSEGFKAVGRGNLEDAVEPIGATLSGEVGQAGVAGAQQAVTDAYTGALSGLNLRADQPFMTALAGAVNRGRAVPVMGEQFDHLMRTKFGPLFGPGVTLDGSTAQAALQTVRGARSQFAKEGQMGSLVADELDAVDAALVDLISRQSPAHGEGLANANKAFSMLRPIEDAATTAVNSGMGAGVWTPSQLNRAVASNTKNYGGKAAAARGDRQTPLMRAAQEVLPSSVPNSGTVDRALGVALPAVLGGGAYSVSDISPTTAGVLSALALASSRPGGDFLQSALVRRPDAARKAGQALIDNSRIGGLIGGPLALNLIPTGI